MSSVPKLTTKERLTTILTILAAEEMQGGIQWDGVLELINHINAQTAWIADLQSGMYINCVYCGHRYGPAKNTPVAMADILKAHIEECSQHPMSALKLELAAIKAKVFVEVETWLEAARMIAGARMYRDYYTPDLHDDELQEFNAIIAKFQAAQEQLPEPSAETYARWLMRCNRERSKK